LLRRIKYEIILLGFLLVFLQRGCSVTFQIKLEIVKIQVIKCLNLNTVCRKIWTASSRTAIG
jgi:hypothetical protein